LTIYRSITAEIAILAGEVLEAGGHRPPV